MKPIFKKIAWGMLAVFVGMQFYRPSMNISEETTTAFFEAETSPPGPILETLQTSCYDCHSNNTNYPWYNQVAPVSYFIDAHIKDGKKHLNFSEWESYATKKKDHKIEELIEEIQEGEMPLKSYRITHGNITEEQAKGLIAWGERNRVIYEYKMRYKEGQAQ